jgi:hypothetical protein
MATHLESSAWCGLANVAVSKQHLQLGAIKGLAHVFLATPRGLDALLKGLGANISDDDGCHVVGDGRRTVGDGCHAVGDGRCTLALLAWQWLMDTWWTPGRAGHLVGKVVFCGTGVVVLHGIQTLQVNLALPKHDLVYVHALRMHRPCRLCACGGCDSASQPSDNSPEVQCPSGCSVQAIQCLDL